MQSQSGTSPEYRQFVHLNSRWVNPSALLASYYSIVTVNSPEPASGEQQAQAAYSGAKPEATGIAKTRHVGVTIDVPQGAKSNAPVSQ
jgi:hypothetical protein